MALFVSEFWLKSAENMVFILNKFKIPLSPDFVKLSENRVSMTHSLFCTVLPFSDFPLVWRNLTTFAILFINQITKTKELSHRMNESSSHHFSLNI